MLELAFGTGEITSVLLALGFRVTGLDLTEAMLRKAKAKHAGASDLSLFLGDAEDTREDDESHDAIVMRHLVWTWTRTLTSGSCPKCTSGMDCAATGCVRCSLRPVLRTSGTADYRASGKSN